MEGYSIPDQGLSMRRMTSTGVLLVSMASASLSFANEACSQLPDSLQGVSVSHISRTDELDNLDNRLEAYLQPCLRPVTAENRKAICANGRLVAEQVLRVISRIDQAAKRNDFLSKAKIKSYKAAALLLDRTKQLVTDKTCV